MSAERALKERVIGSRGEKQRVELLLPGRVVRDMADLARRQRVSLNKLVLEMLKQDGRIPINDEDFLDLRRAPTICKCSDKGSSSPHR